MDLRIFEVNENKTVFVLQNSKLTEVKVVKIIYHLTDSKCYDIQNVVIEHKGKEVVVSVKDIYNSVKSFTQGNPIECNYRRFRDIKGYYWDDAKSQPEYFDIMLKGHNLIYDFSTRELSVDGYVPEDLFDRNDDVRKYYPIQVEKLDGTTEIHGGVLAKLLLNEEQMQVVEEFRSVLRKMKENNISFIIERDKGYVFKSDDIKYISSYGDCEHDVQFLNKYHIKELEWNEGIYKGEWGDGVSVEFKK